MTDKNNARQYVRQLRDGMSEQENHRLSRIICDKLFDMKAFINSSDIRAYVSFRNEVNTIPLIEKCLTMNKTISVPKVYGEDMIFYRIQDTSDLCEGYMGIREPSEDLPVMYSHSGIIIVPGMVFDRRGNRAGYGRGFYDRYLAKFPELIKIGVAFDFQLVDEIDTNPFDVAMDYILTDTEIIKII